MKKTALFLLCLSTTLLSQAQSNSTITQELTKDLEALVQEDHLVGFSVALYNEEGTLYEKGFGLANKATGEKYTSHTIQNIASISKTFIAIALLKAQELGKLDLDDPINNYMPFEVVNPYHPDEQITIRQLSSHISSIVDRGWWYGFNSYVLKEKKKPGEKKKIYFSNPDKMISLGELYENYLMKGGKNYKKKSFSKQKPGDKYEYSNIAAALGAYILEQATGEDFKTFTKKYIFDPLNMQSTGWSFDDIEIAKHSRIYTKSKKPLAFYSLVTYPDGGLRTSSFDMAMYASELIKGYNGIGTLLTTDSYQEAFTGSLNELQVAGRGGDDYGVFFEVTDNNQIGHSGSDPGVTTLMYFNTQTNTGRYLQVNTEVTKKSVDNFRAIYAKLKEYESQFE